MMQTVKTALRNIDISDFVSNPGDDYRKWRNSDRPAYNFVHGLLETVLVVGLGLRYLCHMVGYAIYHQSQHGEPPDFSDDMFGFTNLVEPVLGPEHWHQEALMRGFTFFVGLFVFMLAVGTRDTTQYMMYDFITPEMVYWGRMFLATHLLLDPLLGVAHRLATADLRGRFQS